MNRLASYPPLSMCRYCNGGPWPPHQMQEHYTSCTRILGRNVSTTHASVKLLIKDVLQHGGVQTTGAEEAYRRTVCGCGAEFTPDAFESHRSLLGCRYATAGTFRDTRADGKVLVTTGDPNIVWDNTSPNAMGVSHLKQSLLAFCEASARAKHKRYAGDAKANGDSFAALVLPLHGARHPETLDWIATFATLANVPKELLYNELRRVVELGAGAVQASVERREGLLRTLTKSAPQRLVLASAAGTASAVPLVPQAASSASEARQDRPSDDWGWPSTPDDGAQDTPVSPEHCELSTEVSPRAEVSDDTVTADQRAGAVPVTPESAPKQRCTVMQVPADAPLPDPSRFSTSGAAPNTQADAAGVTTSVWPPERRLDAASPPWVPTRVATVRGLAQRSGGGAGVCRRVPVADGNGPSGGCAVKWLGPAGRVLCAVVAWLQRAPAGVAPLPYSAAAPNPFRDFDRGVFDTPVGAARALALGVCRWLTCRLRTLWVANVRQACRTVIATCLPGTDVQTRRRVECFVEPLALWSLPAWLTWVWGADVAAFLLACVSPLLSVVSAGGWQPWCLFLPGLLAWTISVSTFVLRPTSAAGYARNLFGASMALIGASLLFKGAYLYATAAAQSLAWHVAYSTMAYASSALDGAASTAAGFLLTNATAPPRCDVPPPPFNSSLDALFLGNFSDGTPPNMVRFTAVVWLETMGLAATGLLFPVVHTLTPRVTDGTSQMAATAAVTTTRAVALICPLPPFPLLMQTALRFPSLTVSNNTILTVDSRRVFVVLLWLRQLATLLVPTQAMLANLGGLLVSAAVAARNPGGWLTPRPVFQ